MTNDQMTAQGKRLQQAREEKRYTRAALAEKAGLPMKSLEKYEAGTMDIPLSRLNALASALELDLGDLLVGVSTIPAKPSESAGTQNLEGVLVAIDTARAEGFETRWREVPSLINDALELLARVSLDELATVAEQRGLHEFSVPEWLEAVSVSDIESAKKLTSEIEARVVDSAVLGVDLYSLDDKQLSSLADAQNIEGDEWMGLDWSGKEALVNALRPALFRLAMDGQMPAIVGDTSHDE